MKKKLFALLLAGAIVFAFAACTGQGDGETKEGTTQDGGTEADGGGSGGADAQTSVEDIVVADGVEIDDKQSIFVIPGGTVAYVDDYSISYSLQPNAHEDAIKFYEKLATDLKVDGSPIDKESDDPNLQLWEYNGSYDGKEMFGEDLNRNLIVTIVSSPEITSVIVNY